MSQFMGNDPWDTLGMACPSNYVSIMLFPYLPIKPHLCIIIISETLHGSKGNPYLIAGWGKGIGLVWSKNSQRIFVRIHPHGLGYVNKDVIQSFP